MVIEVTIFNYESVGLKIVKIFQVQRNRASMLNNSKGLLSKFMIFFGYLMAAIYVGLGIVLLSSDIFPVKPLALKFSFALFFIAYGFFRLVKLITKKTETNDD